MAGMIRRCRAPAHFARLDKVAHADTLRCHRSGGLAHLNDGSRSHMIAAAESKPTASARRPLRRGVGDVLVGALLAGARVATVAGSVTLFALAVGPAIWPGTARDAGYSAAILQYLGVWPAVVTATLTVVACASAVSLAIALPLAFLLFRTDLPNRTSFAGGLLLPACLPLYVGATILLSVIGMRRWDGCAWMVGVIHGLLGVPLATLQLGAGYRSIDGNLEEAAVLDASWRRVAFRLDPRLMLWSIAAVVGLQTWFAATDITVSDLLAVRTLAEEVYVTFQLYGSARAASLLVIPYLALFAFLILGVLRGARGVDLDLASTTRRSPPTIALGRWRRPLFFVVVGIASVAVAGPVWVMATQVGGWSRFTSAALSLRPELRDSTLLAGLAAALLVLVTMGVADLAPRRSGSGRVLRLALLLLLALPTPCLAIALKELMNRPGILGAVHDSMLLPIVGQVARWLPLGVLLVLPGWMNVTADMRRAARLDGCDAVRLHRYICWPIAARHLLLLGVVGAICVLGEVTANVLLSPPGFLPLSVRFFTLAHYGLEGQAATTCVLTAGLIVIPWAALIYILDSRDLPGG
jgi:iron(III) transport system permease protein